MRHPNVTWRIILYDYLFTTEPRHTCTSGEFSNYRVRVTHLVDVGLRKAPCISCYLSTFRGVSNTNYFLVCSLPIHASSSANAEGPRAHCQLKSCKMLHNVPQIAFEKACNLWKTFKVIQCHCRCSHLIGHIGFPISLPL